MPQHDPVPPRRASKPRPPKIPCAEVPNDVRYSNGGRAKRIYSPAGKRWNAGLQQKFLEALAASGNVTWSASEVRISADAAYYHRRKRPEFARRWAAALDHAYDMLEFELVTAARQALTDLAFPGELKIKPMAPADAIRVLAHYKASLGRGGRISGSDALPKPMEDVREDILRVVRAIRNARPPKR